MARQASPPASAPSCTSWKACPNAKVTPASRLSDLAGELAEIREQVTAFLNPKNTLELVTLLVKRQLVEVVEAFRVVDPTLLDRLVEAREEV